MLEVYFFRPYLLGTAGVYLSPHLRRRVPVGFLIYSGYRGQDLDAGVLGLLLSSIFLHLRERAAKSS